MDQKAERVAGQGNPIAVSAFLTKPADIAITLEAFQHGRIAHLYFVRSASAATIARLAYEVAQ